MVPARWIVSSEMGNITLGLTSGATALAEPTGMGLIDSIFPASRGNPRSFKTDPRRSDDDARSSETLPTSGQALGPRARFRLTSVGLPTHFQLTSELPLTRFVDALRV